MSKPIPATGICGHPMSAFVVADSNGAMYCTICYPELFS